MDDQNLQREVEWIDYHFLELQRKLSLFQEMNLLSNENQFEIQELKDEMENLKGKLEEIKAKLYFNREHEEQSLKKKKRLF